MDAKFTDTNKLNKIPSNFQKRTLWIAITSVSMVLIFSVLIGCIYLGTKVLSYLQPLLVPIAVTAVIAYLLDPVIKFLERKGLSSFWAMMIVYISFLSIVIILIIIVIVPTFGQAQEVYKSRDLYKTKFYDFAYQGINKVQDKFNVNLSDKYYAKAIDWFSKESPKITSKVWTWISNRLSGALGFFGYLIGIFMVPIYLFYFLREGHKISKSWMKYLPIKSSKFKDELVGTLTEINAYLISFFRGQMLVSLIDGALVAIVLSLIQFPYALLIGVFLAILGMIPYIGSFLVMIPSIVISIVHFGFAKKAIIKNYNPNEMKLGDVVPVETLANNELKNHVISKIISSNNQVSPPVAEVEVLVNVWNWLPQLWMYPVIIIGIFIIVQQINGLFTAPKIVGKSVGLHPLTVIFSILFWSFILGGILGSILAIPLTASIKTLFKRYIWENRLDSL